MNSRITRASTIFGFYLAGVFSMAIDPFTTTQVAPDLYVSSTDWNWSDTGFALLTLLAVGIGVLSLNLLIEEPDNAEPFLFWPH